MSCAGVGFALSRLTRRPQGRAQAAATARAVAGPMAARRGLDAPELQRACFSEMVRHVRVNRDGLTYAPARYRLLLNPTDLAVVHESERWFVDGLASALADAASDYGWALEGPASIVFASDPSRRPGVPLAQVGLEGSAIDQPAVNKGAPKVKGAKPLAGRQQPGLLTLTLVRADTGESIVLDGPTLTIGRSPDNSVVVADERVSRTHARLEPTASGWVVSDLNSSNGTRLDGTRINPGVPAAIGPGSVIAVGPLELKVISAGAQGGSRALADSDRTRISAEVLGRSSHQR